MNTSIPSADDIVTNVIQSLSDNPNESGLSAEELKVAFDQSASNIKTYLQSLENALETKFAGVYPVGSIYMSVNNVNPTTLFGGTWEQIQDKFLLSAGSTYTAGDTGGAATVTLTTNQIPSHSHSFGRYVPSSGNGWHGDNGNMLSGGNGTYVYADVNNIGNITGTQASGGGQAHNNMPPYLVVYVWKRIS